MKVGEKIAAARQELGREWTQQKLADELTKAGHKVKRTWVTGVELGRFNLHKEFVPALARILRKPAAYFADDALAGVSLVAETEPSGEGFVYAGKNMPMIPVLGSVCADRFTFSFETYPEQYLPIPAERGRNLFALRISGDCMEPTFRDKDLVIINPNEPPADGKVVLAQLDGEFTLKRYFLRADGVELKPDNARYKVIKAATNKMTIRGVVIGTYRRDV